MNDQLFRAFFKRNGINVRGIANESPVNYFYLIGLINGNRISDKIKEKLLPIMRRYGYNEWLQDMFAPDPDGRFVLYKDDLYWNGKEFQPHKHNIPKYEWGKASEFSELLGCEFGDG